MCYGIIYKIENKINGKIYIGQTVRNFDERYRGSIKNTHNEYLKRSIEIHGIENFEIDKCVCACETKEELDRVEQFYIYVYDAANPEHGYNLTFGGEGGIPNEETRKKISEALSGEKHPMYNKHHSEKSRQKISENTKKALADPEIKKKQSENTKKALADPEIKKKQSENVKKALADPEIKKKQSENVKKALADPETRKKMSEAHKGEKNSMYGKNPEDYMTEEAIKIKRKKISEALSGEKHPMYGKNAEDYMTPEAIQMRRKKISENAKKMWENSEYRKNMSEKLSGKNNPSAKSIIQLDKEENFIKKWDYINEAAKELNIARQSISHCCSGRYKSAGGYKWMYLEDYLDLLQYAF